MPITNTVKIKLKNSKGKGALDQLLRIFVAALLKEIPKALFVYQREDTQAGAIFKPLNCYKK